MPGPYYEYEALTFLSLVWMLFLPHFPVLAKTGQSETERRLRFFLIFIENHYQEDISLTDIAASAHVSKSECLRCFQTHLHTTPYRYLVDVRLKHAVNHLCSSHGTISEIALRSGFNHFSHFSRSFRAKTGMSPKEFRKRKFLDEKTGITSDTTLDD